MKGHHKRTHPVSDIEEALLAGEVKHQQEPHGVPKECRRQTAEPGTRRKQLSLKSETLLGHYSLSQAAIFGNTSALPSLRAELQPKIHNTSAAIRHGDVFWSQSPHSF